MRDRLNETTFKATDKTSKNLMLLRNFFSLKSNLLKEKLKKAAYKTTKILLGLKLISRADSP